MATTKMSCAWYRQPAMLVVTGVLVSSVLSGIVIASFAVSGRDPLVVSAADYQKIRDEFRLTEPWAEDHDSP